MRDAIKPERRSKLLADPLADIDAAFRDGKQHGADVLKSAIDCPFDHHGRQKQREAWMNGFSIGRIEASEPR